MKRLYNERQNEMVSRPSDLMVLEEFNKRGALDADFKEQLEHLRDKEIAHLKVMECLRRYAKEHWHYMVNVAINYDNTFTCDLLVMTSTHVYALEINDFNGAFSYQNGNSSLNGQSLKKQPITMAQNVRMHLQHSKQMAPMPIDLTIKGAALFTHPDCSLDIPEEVNGIDIVPADQIETFIQQMVQDEKQETTNEIPFNPTHFSWAARIDRHHPYLPIEIPDHFLKTIHPGILCTHCESFEVKIGEVLMTCECGGWETTEEAIVRTICEYAILVNGDPLHIPSLRKFFNKQVPWHQIEKGLEMIYIAIH